VWRSFDPSLGSARLVGLDSGFDAFPLVDPLILGNSSRTGALSGLDAAYVAQKAAVMSWRC
jgi:hypothetical protein